MTVTASFDPLDPFLALSRQARQASSARELGFVLVNDSLALAHYRQAALWLQEEGVYTLSGVLQVDRHVPYVQWLDAVCRHLHAQWGAQVRALQATDLPYELAAQWAQWWPQHALWLGHAIGGAVWVRDAAWDDAPLAVLQDWRDVWWHAFAALHRPRLGRWRQWRERIRFALVWQEDRAWWRQRRLQWLAALLLVLCWPVRLSVLAPGELVAAQPLVIRAPLEGVIDVFHVQPNQQVQAEQPLFSFDEIALQSRLEVAQQTLATAEAEYRQTSQMALSDAKAKTQLALLIGRIEEKRADVDYLQEQLARARVLAPQAGVVLMDDPSEWIGKPVATGERILRIAALHDMEVEAWIPMADAIGLEPGDNVTLYLSASPLSPVSAQLRYMAHDAVQRPDGSFAYRVRGKLEGKTEHRVGLKGTAKLQGRWVPLTYWVLRRPMATLRAYLGF